MKFNRPIRALAFGGIAAALLGGGVAMATPGTPSGVSASSATSSPSPVQVTNFPATQNVAGSVSVANLPSTQPVSGTVNIGNLPATQTVAGTVQAQQAGTWNVGITGTPTVSVADQTVAITQWQYPNAGTVDFVHDVSAYKTLIVDAGTVTILPAGCTVTVQVTDVVRPDNVTGSWSVPEATATLTPADIPQHVVVPITSPNLMVYTTDQPYGCASSTPLNLGVYGRPN